MAALLERKLEGVIAQIEIAPLLDLDDDGKHLDGIATNYMKLSFRNVQDLMTARSMIKPVVQKNKRDKKRRDTMHALAMNSRGDNEDEKLPDNFLEAIQDIREYDVPYYVRVNIDLDVRVGKAFFPSVSLALLCSPRVEAFSPCLFSCSVVSLSHSLTGAWYDVTTQPHGEGPNTTGITCNALTRLPNMMEKAEPRVFAFDIECTKEPLKFPNAQFDTIFMISYMFDGEGFLITDREVVSQDIEDFEYTPRADYPGPFTVFNEPNEEVQFLAMLNIFASIVFAKPISRCHCFVTMFSSFIFPALC